MWPWKNVDPSPEEMRRAGGRCELWAEKIQNAVGGQIMRITPKSGVGYIGPVRKQSGRFIHGEFLEHFAVRVGDRVYDRITGPDGLPFNEYRQLFDYADDLLFETI